MGADSVVHCVHNDTAAVALLTYNSEHKNIGTVGVDVSASLSAAL